MLSASSRAISSVLLIFAAGPLLAQGGSVSMDELQACRDYEDPAERMACYDNIDKTTAPAHAAEPAPAVAPAPEAVPAIEADPQPATAEVPESAARQQPQPAEASLPVEPPPAAAPEEQYQELTDDVGLPKSDDSLQTIRATVARCGEASNRRFYFYFDNGQVWKYLGRKKLRFLDCDNQASLIEDGWGFKLKLDGDERPMRVQRVK